MNISSILQLITALAPVAEGIATIWVHNPNSQHKLAVIVSDVETVAAIATQLPGLLPGTQVNTMPTAPPTTPAPGN